jgi:hypothetical protein
MASRIRCDECEAKPEVERAPQALRLYFPAPV